LNGNYPKLIIKYEELFTNTFDVFYKILKFLSNFKEIEIEKNKINNTSKEHWKLPMA